MAKKPVKKSVKSKKPAKAAHKPAAKKAHAAKPAPAKKAAHKPAAAHKPVAKKSTAAAAKKAHATKPAAHKPAAPKKAAAVHHAKPAPAKKAHEKEKHAKPAPVAKAPHPAPVEKPAKKKAKQAPEEEVEVPEDTAEGEGEEEESEEVVLTDAEGRRYCRVKDCDQLSTVEGYCRYHYLLFWKKIQVRKKILTEGKLERYIEELTARYPDKFLDMLRKDLRSDKEFLAAIAELEIDESATENEFEDEAQTYIDEVRGMAETPARDDEDF